MVFCLQRAVLYPGTKIAVAAPTVNQAVMLLDKAEALRSSYKNIDNEILSISSGKDHAIIKLKNGQEIETVVASENARGKRCNILILDEGRLMDNTIVSMVLRNFLTSKRTPPYLNNPKYAKYIEMESNKEIFLSSVGMKEEWSYQDFLKYLEFIKDGRKEYCVLQLPYQFGVQTGIIDRKLIERNARESKTDIKIFQQEMGVIPFGESESAMFKYDVLNSARKMLVPLIPITDDEYIEYRGDITKSPYYQKKMIGEIRVISMDIAVAAGKKNDNTVFEVFRLTENGDHYDKELSYIEVLNGVNLDPQILRFKQLFYNLECDYAVIDAGGGLGINAVNTCGQITTDIIRNVKYPGWKTCDMVEKFDMRVADPNAEPVLYTVQVSGLGASNMQYTMLVNARLEFERKRMSLLVNEDEAVEQLNKRYKYLKLKTQKNRIDSEKANNMMTSFVNTTSLIRECINTNVVKLPSGRITYDEKSGRKDRVTCMLYGLYFINLLEEDLVISQRVVNYQEYAQTQQKPVAKRNLSPFAAKVSRNGFRGFLR